LSPLPGINPDESLWAWLSYDLRMYREARGLTQADVGRLIGVTKQQVHNLESGIRKLNRKQAGILDAEWGTGGHFTRLRKYAEEGHDPDWFKAFVMFEARARTIKSYTLAVVHGLLQTPEYARALLTSGRVDDVDAGVSARMARQEILSRQNPPEIWALINESVIDQPVGGPEVMRRQLDYLLEMSTRPNIVLRAVPRRTGAYMGLDGSFTVISTRNECVAYLEAFGGGRLAQESAEVAEFALRFELIGADALSRADSRLLIQQIMETMA